MFRASCANIGPSERAYVKSASGEAYASSATVIFV